MAAESAPAPDHGVYAQVKAPDNLAQLIAGLHNRGVEMPLIDVLTEAVATALVVGASYDRGDEIDVEDEPPQQAAAAPAPAAPALPPSVGSVHTTVPAGCSTVEKDGKFLRSCGGALYAERFEGDRLVYEVVAP
jgi:hypothetical protein